jgi:hypothetical protein
MFHSDPRRISYPHQPLATKFVVALQHPLCNRTKPYAATTLSNGSGHFQAKPFFPVNTPTFLKHSHSTPIGLWRWNKRSVPKSRHIKFRRQEITQKKAYNIFINWEELPRRARRPILLYRGDLAILCRPQNMWWFSEPTAVLWVMVVNIGVVLYA